MAKSEIPFGVLDGEEPYLSRLQAQVVNVRGRGVIDGSETVERLFEVLRVTVEGKEAARAFIKKHGRGKPSRTTIKPKRLAPRSAYK